MSQQYPQSPIQPQTQPPELDSQGFPKKPKKSAGRKVLAGVAIVSAAVVSIFAVIVVIAIASVGSSEDEVAGTLPNVVTSEPAPATTAPSSAPTEAPATTEAPPASDDSSTIGGGWLTYESGIAVRVTKAKVYTLDSYDAAKARGNKGVAVTVSIKNGSAAAFDAALASIKLQYGPDGVEADSTVGDNYDTFGFTGTIAKGKTKTVTIGFSVPPKYTKDLLVQVEPDWNSETTNFTGGAR